MGKVSALTVFLLQPGAKDYTFLDQAMEEFRHGLDSIFMNSVKTLSWIHPLMSLAQLSSSLSRDSLLC